MKKIVSMLVCLLVLFTLGACEAFGQSDGTDNASTTPEPAIESTTEPTPVPTDDFEPLTLDFAEEPIIIHDISLVTPTPAPTPTPEPTPAPTPLCLNPHPSNDAPMYSSYAFMVSYNPSRDWADFDFFELLTGDDAVAWLVDHEGYTLTNAQAEVAEFADSEYICKNTDKQTRTIDLSTVLIKLMYLPDGTMVDGCTPVDSDVSDVFALYNLDTKYLYDYNFFYIHVNVSGNVTLVEQVYWP